MRRLVLFFAFIMFAGLAFGQTLNVKECNKPFLKNHFFRDIPQDPPGTKNAVNPSTEFTSDLLTQPSAVTIIAIGQSVNAYGFYGGNRTYIWADNNINSVSFVHRMVSDGGYGGSRVSYDISKDGGLTWTNNIRIYEPIGPGGANPLAAGRYPQGSIFNPSGNNVPGDAYFTYFVPTLDCSNGDTWGGYGYGLHKLDSTQEYTQHNVTTVGAKKQNVPDSYTLLPNGTFFVADPAVTGGIASQYTDTMVISKGVFNSVSNDYELTQDLLYFPVDKYISDTKVAFGPDGMTGYISVLTNHDTVTFEPLKAFYPVVLKTTDGGNTWGDPVYVKLWGPDGLNGIKNWLTDSAIAAFFEPPIPTRDEIPYTTAWEHDVVVDMNGNPHICVVIGISGEEWNIYTARDYIAVFDIYSTDGGTTWDARPLDSLKTFDGEFGGSDGITEYNRVQISRTMDGSKLFYSWLDTDIEGSTDNNQPNIYCKGFSVTNQTLTNTYNVTKFTGAYSQAYMGSQSHYVFNTSNSYEIPFVYQEMDPLSPADPVQYRYIRGFTILESSFLGIEQLEECGASISDAWPNPSDQSVTIEINLQKSMKCSYTVANLTGQVVFQGKERVYPAGKSDLKMDVSRWSPGIYLINITIGQQMAAKKVVVK